MAVNRAMSICRIYESLYILNMTGNVWRARSKQLPAGDLTRNTGDLFEAATIAPVVITKHRSRVRGAVDGAVPGRDGRTQVAGST